MSGGQPIHFIPRHGPGHAIPPAAIPHRANVCALKMLGVPTKLIPMRGEYHGTGRIPSNFMRTQLYIRKWFDEHTPAAGGHAEDG